MLARGRAERAELDAAGITDSDLRAAYLSCRALHAAHGRTYFLATRLLPAPRRVHVHALYGFARLADEIVDAPAAAGQLTAGPSADPTAGPAARLDALGAELDAALSSGASDAGSPVVRAVAHTARRYALDPALFTAFLASMRMDLTVTGYADAAELAGYVHGSAAVIGLQMLPVLGTVGPPADAEPAAALLGAAFQMTNFLRDVGEDLDRGRVYLPADELAAFGVHRDLLVRCRRERRTDPRVRRAIAHLVASTHGTYRRAEAGIALLEPASRECVRAAARLYEGILGEIESTGYDVLNQRATVPGLRRAAVALPAAARVARARLISPSTRA